MRRSAARKTQRIFLASRFSRTFLPSVLRFASHTPLTTSLNCGRHMHYPANWYSESPVAMGILFAFLLRWKRVRPRERLTSCQDTERIIRFPAGIPSDVR